ncbi:metal ABC transporter substrate-binding protein [Propioniciclava sinopodophylli]|uniref:metal ABC transporter substrate-binding protein n=1 Tax=Propioniciclava sinopodophylli TaxID=1837344 RepID=UPI002493336F|nr:metal ABC transporter substrate-binding protein [Propioniciclava sinopodophylli]
MRFPIMVAPLVLTLTACSTGALASAGPSQGTPVAIATTSQLGSILGDITQCAGTTSATLMGPGDDPHDFALSSRDVAALTRAKLIVASGLGLEPGIQRALAGATADGATLFEVAPLLDPLKYGDAGPERGGEHAEEEGQAGQEAHEEGEFDPHVHMDAGRMAKAAGLMGGELTKLTGESKYTDCGQQVQTQLEATDVEVRTILSAVPAEKRVLITDHDAYSYFADAYGFEVAGVVIPGGSTDAEPSSAELADLVKVVQQEGVGAIFSNNTVNPRLVEAVAAEAGSRVKVVQLFEGSVGPEGSGAETYAGMMLADARLVADALK